LASDDWTLLERWARDRDAEAFAEVATRYAGVVYGACRRVFGEPSAAEDAAQECFLTLAQTRKPPKTNLGAWLHRVAVNKARDRVKSASRRRDRERRYMNDQPSQTEIAWREIESLVDDAIAKLPEDFRETLVAHFMRGQTHADIAERLGVSRQLVTYRIGKGIDRIRTSLRKNGIPIGATALTASLAANMAEAAPATLVAAVGKMAVSGVAAGTGGASAMVGTIAAKHILLGFGICAALGGSWFLLNLASEAPPTTGVFDEQPAKPALQAIALQEEPTRERQPVVPATIRSAEPAPPGLYPAPGPSLPADTGSGALPEPEIMSNVVRADTTASRFTAHTEVPGAGLAPLPIDLPEPYFGGTPLDYVSENLEERNYKPRKPYLAPAGAVNLAKSKNVTSSDPVPNYGKLAFITDEEKGYQQDFLVELDPGVQWVQIDLEVVADIYAIVVWHFHAAERVYFDVVVKTADDAGFTKDVQSVYNNDHDNSSGLGVGEDKEYVETYEGRLIPLRDKGIQGRYVRLYSNGNTSDETNHYIEVEVYGLPVAAE
jgi:RNA polymerase sigma factor (sigma-70 family)